MARRNAARSWRSIRATATSSLWCRTRLRSEQLCGRHRFSDLEATHGERRPTDSKPSVGRTVSTGFHLQGLRGSSRSRRGAITPDDRVFCPGTFKLGRRTYRCWKRGGHGSVNLHEALVRSCDVFFYQLGLKLGIDRIAFFANGFHLGRRTGIALGNESPGIVPTQAWKERRFGEVWLKGETVSASIGQGFNLTTPMQLAVAYAAIANGGTIFRPRILLRQAGPDGTVEQGPEPESLGKVPVSPGPPGNHHPRAGSRGPRRGGDGRAGPDSRRARGWQDRNRPGGSPQGNRGSGGGRDPIQIPGSRMVRGFCARRSAGDRGRRPR